MSSPHTFFSINFNFFDHFVFCSRKLSLKENVSLFLYLLSFYLFFNSSYLSYFFPFYLFCLPFSLSICKFSHLSFFFFVFSFLFSFFSAVPLIFSPLFFLPSILSFLISCLLSFSLQPFFNIITAVNLGIIYATDKYMILRYYRKPSPVNSTLPRYVSYYSN